MDEPGYRPVPVAPDPERDKRVAARRAADAARAARALDRLLSDVEGMTPVLAKAFGGVYGEGWRDGYAASELHHNGHYGVPAEGHPCPYRCGRDDCPWVTP